MKSAGQFILCLAAVALISAFARADDLAVADTSNPYTAISERNIFALVPVPTNAPVSDTPPADPPPKITANGIMTLFGNLEVLFKVATKPPPGQPAQDASYVLGVGDRQDEIEVTKIDDKAKPPVITFINHGVEQDIPLDDTAKLTTPAQGPIISGGGGMMNRGGIGGGIPMPGRGFGGQGAPGPGANPMGAPSSNPGNGIGAANNAAAQPVSPEDQVINMEQQRAKWLDEKNPAAMIIPPTALGKQLIGGDGAPEPPTPP